MPTPTTTWPEPEEVGLVPSPALFIQKQWVEENVRRMIALGGGVARLRPHLKTHKMAEIVKLQLDAGITHFKCATVAEAEMAAACEVPDLLLAYQPVGPNAARVVQLVSAFPGTRFSVLCDDAQAAAGLSQVMHGPGSRLSKPLEVLVDLDVGQHRTGLLPGDDAARLYVLLSSLPGLKPVGLHAYDGHILETNFETRTAACDRAFAPVQALREALTAAGFPRPRVVAGGTPTFPIHARRSDVECSPGTCVLWDAGYARRLPDLDFIPAASLLTRVVSKPGKNRLCLDLGHKAVASEMPPPRVLFPAMPDAQAIAHSEEHLVIETTQADHYPVGSPLYGTPWHICPTVALHAEAVVVEQGRVVGSWKVSARERRLTI